MLTEKEIAIDISNIARVYNTSIGVFRRQYKQVKALDNISFSVEQNELYGLVGPNGAGKTTLIKILCTLLLPTSGKATVLGMDVATQERDIRKSLNVVFGGERGLYTRLSGINNLKLFADLYQVPRDVSSRRIPELLDLVGLNGRGHERVEGYSKGMKQRLHIAKALINDPKVLFLDEPTIGLDPNISRKLRKTISDLQQLGKTIILTSHYMYEVDALCKRIAIINKGKLVTVDSPYNLKRHTVGLYVLEAQISYRKVELTHTLMEDLIALDYVENVVTENSDLFQTLIVRTYAPARITTILKEKFDADDIVSILTREPTLEDAYIKLIGDSA